MRFLEDISELQYMNIKPKIYDDEKNFAVVSWFNYRKEHHCGCMAVFKKYSDAREYAYNAASYNILRKFNSKYFQVDEQDKRIVKNILQKQKLTSHLDQEDRVVIEKMSEKYSELTEFNIISEDEITDCNGPGESQYKSIESFGNSITGYSTTFYCVVDYFHGIENRWNFDEGFVPVVDSSFNPEYC